MKSKYFYETTKISISLYIFLLFVLLNTVTSNKKWCWTKTMVNEPSFVLNTKNGGMNWAYCMDPKKVPPRKFFAVVQTSAISHSGTK